ncbi:MAG TPA: hypothetical protein VG871_16875, partial [Vicinamibacterales bacterium]|nr:hypothetical protein [Vicinamibacterales bacterium]
MGYIDSSLLPGETVVARARCHWIVFAKAMAIVVAGLIVLAFSAIAGLIILGIGVVAALPPLVTYTTSEFGVTSKRVVIK